MPPWDFKIKTALFFTFVSISISYYYFLCLQISFPFIGIFFSLLLCPNGFKINYKRWGLDQGSKKCEIKQNKHN